jgi:hypothetical protein
VCVCVCVCVRARARTFGCASLRERACTQKRDLFLQMLDGKNDVGVNGSFLEAFPGSPPASSVTKDPSTEMWTIHSPCLELTWFIVTKRRLRLEAKEEQVSSHMRAHLVMDWQSKGGYFAHATTSCNGFAKRRRFLRTCEHILSWIDKQRRFLRTCDHILSWTGKAKEVSSHMRPHLVMDWQS